MVYFSFSLFPFYKTGDSIKMLESVFKDITGLKVGKGSTISFRLLLVLSVISVYPVLSS